MPTAALKILKAHPAQMRTIYDLESLATLTLQVYERGLDQWQPITATPNGGGFYIVSGHRRHMARLLAFAMRDWANEHPDTEITIEVVRTMINTLVESLGSLEKLVASLLTKYGDEEISFVTFEGSQKAQILALQAANYGSDQPDMMGVAHSFRQAVAAGATPEEIARNVGQHLNYVLNHLALADIPLELAQRIAAGELPMSVATAVADLPEPKRTGLSIFILANEPGKLTAKTIKECATTLKKWPGLQMPLLVKHQSQRNVARALVRLWSQVEDAYPEDAYAAAAMFIYRGVHEEPWGSQEKLTLWFQALGGDTYFTDGHFGKLSAGSINWTAVVEYLITEVACETCPVAQLPKQQLRSDLSQGQGGPLGMPCRVGQDANRCIHGLTPNDSFDVRVPWEWGQHPGIVNDGGDYRAMRYEDLFIAWQAQADKEQAEDETPVATDNDEPEATAVAKQDTSSVNRQQQNEVTNPTRPAKDSPIAKQRAQIADFMKRHEQLAANHSFATPCGRCRHLLDSSPTKDESVPHCAWAGRLRSVTFKVLEPDGKDSGASVSLPIPVCRQFAPNQPWPELIPAHPEPPGIPRDWLKVQILHLVKEANRHGSDRNAFEFLTGRPMGANENYGDWFSQQLDAQGGDLSDAQLFTLFVWAHAEWQRAKSDSFSLPINGHGMQFATYQERPWRLEPWRVDGNE
ncbi:MAG TPA: ParB/RepB/Spo0J family partition protein [Chloroflexota bacterium]|nr:ParB/RepB/Spo0J family partition protein [Chloroflexota bacterium]HUM67578.1 ParB/RepB/Spo0J family partition protein [Chloroflexota bacterium]